MAGQADDPVVGPFTCNLATKDGYLVSKHHDFDRQIGGVTAQEAEKLEDSEECPV